MDEQVLAKGGQLDNMTKQFIDPEQFTEEMNTHWEMELQNVANPQLKKIWHQIAETFQVHIEHHGQSLDKKWHVLSPPTGTGKTESTIKYFSLLSALADEDHPGGLIVTRRIEDCEKIAERINLFGSRNTAAAFHHKAEVKPLDLKTYPVVVITHRAYQLALDFLGNEGRIEHTWPLFQQWGSTTTAIEWEEGVSSTYADPQGDRGTRKLIVIDECLDIVEQAEVGLDGLRETLGAIPQRIRDKFPNETDFIQGTVNTLEKLDKFSKETTLPQEVMISDEAFTHKLDFTGLIKTLKDIEFVRNNPLQSENQRKKHEARLKNLHYLLRSWHYAGKYGPQHTLHAARLIVPEGVKGGVIMDATASINIVYELFEDAVIIPTPEGARNYGNFTLYVSEDHRLGKVYMEKNATQVCNDLIANLEDILAPGDKVLIGTHLRVEPILVKLNTTFERDTTHYGAIDGSNAWKDFNVAVVFGIPYLPGSWTANQYMALQRPMDTSWLNSEGNRPFRDHIDVRKALERGKISADLVQFLNRTCNRKVIDKKGNCPESYGFLPLPKGEIGKAILDNIKAQMPGMKVKTWNFKSLQRKIKASKHEEALVTFLKNLPIDAEIAPSVVGRKLGISPKTMNRIVAKVKDTSSELYQTLKQAKVDYETRREQQTLRAYFKKAA